MIKIYFANKKLKGYYSKIRMEALYFILPFIDAES